MRGGHNKKTVEQHIENGTYRPCKHGIAQEYESEILRKMKYEIWKMFAQIKRELEKTDITKEPDKYKNLHSLLMEQVKTFNSLVKNPVGKEEEKKSEEVDLSSFAP
jgi:endonuclease III-like uncharacterized protein